MEWRSIGVLRAKATGKRRALSFARKPWRAGVGGIWDGVESAPTARWVGLSASDAGQGGLEARFQPTKYPRQPGFARLARLRPPWPTRFSYATKRSLEPVWEMEYWSIGVLGEEGCRRRPHLARGCADLRGKNYGFLRGFPRFSAQIRAVVWLPKPATRWVPSGLFAGAKRGHDVTHCYGWDQFFDNETTK